MIYSLKKLITSLIIILFATTPAFATEKLIFSLDLIRHGDRTPIESIPNSPIQFKEGLGQLTQKGVHQEIALGKNMRQQYVYRYHLLPEKYNPDTMYVRSTDMSRTILSADAFLMGLYPPAKRSPYDRPIPIHVVALDRDKLLVSKPKKNIFSLVYLYYLYQKNWHEMSPPESKLDYWSKQTGIPITNFKKLGQLADNLYIRELNHIPLPNGISNEDANEIISLDERVMLKAFEVKQITDPMGEEFLKTVKNYFDEAVHHSSSLKYVLLSGHDSSIMSVMNTLDSPLDKAPPYASRVNFSLFEENNQYYVKITYNNKPIYIRKCGSERCSLLQFEKLLSC